jgi:hypothetical protein
MKVVVIFDGSDDGLVGLQRAAAMMKASGKNPDITASLVGWPPRKSPIWDKAFSKHPIVDDLHRAMAEVAAIEFGRLKQLFADVGGMFKTEYLEGDAVTNREKPDLFVAGLTRGPDADSVLSGAFAILRQTAVPSFLTFGEV